jgi:hypothetical protein
MRDPEAMGGTTGSILGFPANRCWGEKFTVSPLSAQWRCSGVDRGVGGAPNCYIRWHPNANASCPPTPPRWIQCNDASADAYDVASSLSCNDNNDDNNDHGGSVIPMDDSDAIRRGYNDCRKAIAGEIALAGAADVPVAEEWEEAMGRGGETKSMEVCTDVLMLPRCT